MKINRDDLERRIGELRQVIAESKNKADTALSLLTALESWLDKEQLKGS